MSLDQKNGKAILWALLWGGALGLAVYMVQMGHWGEALRGALAQPLASLSSLIAPIGSVFIRLLKMVMVPLVFSSIFMAIVNLGSPGALGSMGKRAFGYYFCTTALAVFLGLIFVNLIQPGIGADLGNAGLDQLEVSIGDRLTEQKGLFETVIDVIVGAIPSNPVQAFATSSVLQIICLAILFALVALYQKDESQPVVKVIQSIESMTLTLTGWVMKIAPICIFALMFGVMAQAGMEAIQTLSGYMFTVIVGLLCHSMVLIAFGSFLMKTSPISLVRGIQQALLTAFSTSSSAATLPITMANVSENLGVRKSTAKFVLPLGATVNMDGTALYESVAAIFIAHAYNIDLSLGQQIIIFMTASLAAVGAAAIPGAGLITMGIVLTAVGLPLEGIGLILAVDRILDMFRTTVNVLGDSIGTIFVDQTQTEVELKGGLSEQPTGI